MREKFTNFKKTEKFNYTSGLKEFLKVILNRVHLLFNNCYASDLCNKPIQKYQDAYTKCLETKRAEMYDKSSNLSERERFMIYHAKIARIFDQ